MTAITANGLYGDRARGLFGMAMPTGNGSATSSTSAQAVVEKTYSSIASLVKESATSNKEMIKLLAQQVRLLGDLKKSSAGGLGLSDLLMAKFLGKLMPRLGAGIAAIGMGLGRAAAGLGGIVGGITKSLRTGVTSLFTNLKGSILGGIGKMFTSVSSTVATVTKNMFSGGVGLASKMMGGIGDIAKFLPKAIGLIGKGIGKLFWPITAAVGIFESFKGGFNADKILGKKTSLTEKVLTGLASGINGLLLGIPDWLSNQIGFKNFSVLTDKIADSIKGVGTSIYDFVSTGVASLTSSISSGFSRLKDNLMKIGNWVGDILGTSPAEMEKKRKAGAAGASMGALMGREMQRNNNSSGPIDSKGLNVAQRMDKLEKELSSGSTGAAIAPTTVAGATATVAATAVATTRVATDAIKELTEEATDSLADVKKSVDKKIEASFTESIKAALKGAKDLLSSGDLGAAMKTLEADLARTVSSMPGALSAAIGSGPAGGSSVGGGYSGRGGSSGGAGASGTVAGRPYTPAFTGGIASSSGIKDSAGRVVSTASTNIPAHQRAFLDTIAMGNATSGNNYWESPDYNTIVGGKKFDNYADHPRVFGTATSTAAGRYQFTKTTWDDIKARYNKANPNDAINDFSPQNQDKAAYFLAKADYARRTGGRDLDADLRNNDPNIGNFIKQGLGGQGANTTWEILQRKSGGEIQSAYAANLARNQGYTKGGQNFPGSGGPDNSSGAITAASAANVIMNNAGKIRDLDINPTLKNQLEYAAVQSGVKAEVTSGGQGAIGTTNKRTGSTRHDNGNAADLKLYRVGEDGRRQYLDMNNPADAAIMKKFTSSAVQAGASGVGAGYMGSRTLHIGGGRQNAWGGAPWIGSALEEGVRSREGFDLNKWVAERQATATTSSISQSQQTYAQKMQEAGFTQKTPFGIRTPSGASADSVTRTQYNPATDSYFSKSHAERMGTGEAGAINSMVSGDQFSPANPNNSLSLPTSESIMKQMGGSPAAPSTTPAPYTPTFRNDTAKLAQNAEGNIASNSLFSGQSLSSQTMASSLTKTGDMSKEISTAIGKSVSEEVKAPQQPEFTPIMQTGGFQQQGGAAGGGAPSAPIAPAPVAAAPAASVRDVPSIDEMSMLMANSTMMS